LPAAPEASAQGSYGASAMEAASLAGVRVLLVEDDQDTRELVARILVERKAVWRPPRASMGALEGLASLSPDVLISDISMARQGRLLADPRGPPLAAATATLPRRCAHRLRAPRRTARGRSRPAFDRHVTKPVDMGELCATVASLLRERER
jgi:CheY-like chemotaxis protein